MNDIKIPKMETIKRTAELFRLPVHFVRTKVASGGVPVCNRIQPIGLK